MNSTKLVIQGYKIKKKSLKISSYIYHRLVIDEINNRIKKAEKIEKN